MFHNFGRGALTLNKFCSPPATHHFHGGTLIPSQQHKTTQAPKLSIADLCNTTYNGDGLPELVMEIDALCDSVSRIAGATIGDADIPIAPVDELARLLASIRHEIQEAADPIKALNTLNTAIELAFLHSPVYQKAFEIYRLDLSGELHKVCSAYEAIHEVLQTVRGYKKKQHD